MQMGIASMTEVHRSSIVRKNGDKEAKEKKRWAEKERMPKAVRLTLWSKDLYDDNYKKELLAIYTGAPNAQKHCSQTESKDFLSH